MSAYLYAVFVGVSVKLLSDTIPKHWKSWASKSAPTIHWIGLAFLALAEWCKKRGFLIVARI